MVFVRVQGTITTWLSISVRAAHFRVAFMRNVAVFGRRDDAQHIYFSQRSAQKFNKCHKMSIFSFVFPLSKSLFRSRDEYWRTQNTRTDLVFQCFFFIFISLNLFCLRSTFKMNGQKLCVKKTKRMPSEAHVTKKKMFVRQRH